MFINKQSLIDNVRAIRVVPDELSGYYLALPRDGKSQILQERYGKISYSITGGEDNVFELYQGGKDLFPDADSFFLYISGLICGVSCGEGGGELPWWPIDGERLFIDPTGAIYILEHMTKDSSCVNLLKAMRSFEYALDSPIPEYYRTLISGDNVIAIWSIYDPEYLDGQFLVETKDSYLFYYSC